MRMMTGLVLGLLVVMAPLGVRADDERGGKAGACRWSKPERWGGGARFGEAPSQMQSRSVVASPADLESIRELLGPTTTPAGAHQHPPHRPPWTTGRLGAPAACSKCFQIILARSSIAATTSCAQNDAIKA